MFRLMRKCEAHRNLRENEKAKSENFQVPQPVGMLFCAGILCPWIFLMSGCFLNNQVKAVPFKKQNQ